MKLTSHSIQDNAPIAGDFAFGVPNEKTRVDLGNNLNPHLSWSDAPAGTRSFVVICDDIDVPSVGDDVNVEGREVPYGLPRLDHYFHWVLIDLPASTTAIEAGAYSHEVTPRGKAGPNTPSGARQGINDYTNWFANDADMRGDYYGYDGPCPPWNDQRIHRYVFTVYALDVEQLSASGKFTGQDVLKAIDGHVLASASLTGTYTFLATARL